MALSPRVLVALADPESRGALRDVLPQCGVEAVFTSTLREARAVLAAEPIAMVFCGLHLADGGLHDLLRAADIVREKVPVVVASRVYDTRQYLAAMRLGAFDFIVAPYRPCEVGWIIRNALRRALTPA